MRPQSRKRSGKKLTGDNLSAKLILLPSIAAISVFVYAFIGYTVRLSLSNWNSLVKDMTFAGMENYKAIFESFRFQSDIRNMIYFTIVFIFLVIFFGLLISILLDKGFKGTGLFRTVFFFPMSLSFVVTGVVWRWLLNPASGINALFGTGFKWYTDTSVWPAVKLCGIPIGFPTALFSVVIASLWQLMGFSIAIYLSGLSGISNELREAARIDGANEFQVNIHIIVPMLKPITASVFILMFQISLKVFDLVYTMTGSGPNYVTDMPAVNMYESTFRGHFYAQGAAIAICMLLVVAAIQVPNQILNQKE